MIMIMHSCFCGCGQGVPILVGKDDDWSYSFNDKKEITISPSIATGLKCGSHYWVEDNEVLWSAPISRKKVQKRLKRKRIQELNLIGFIKEPYSFIKKIISMFGKK